MGEGYDLFLRETEELPADHVHGLVKSWIADGHGAVMLGDMGRDARAHFGPGTFFDEPAHALGPEAALLAVIQSEIVQTHDLVLTHGNAAPDLRQIFAETGEQQI